MTFRLRPSSGKGDIRQVLYLAWPVIIQMSAATVQQFISAAMVGRIGSTELGAVGFGGIWIWTLLVAFFGCGTGVQIFVSRQDGAGQSSTCGQWVWHACYVLVPASILLTIVLGLGFETLLGWLGPSPELQAQSALYVKARLPGIPLVILGGIFSSFFRGLGDTRTPMKATLVSMVVHVLAAYGFILGGFGLPKMGVSGAGIAIVLAEIVFTGLLLVSIMRRRLRKRYGLHFHKPNLSLSSRFLATSAPVGGQWLLDMLSFALFSSIVARMGDVQMAASQAMLQLISLGYLQASAIGTATGTLVGRHLGAGSIENAQRSYYSGIRVGLVFATVLGLLFLCIPNILMGIFSNDPRVLSYSKPLLIIGTFFLFAEGGTALTSSALRGGGDTKWPFVVHAVLAWVGRLPLVYFFGITLSGGLIGAWIGDLIFLSILCVIFVLRFRAGHWKTIQI